MQATINGVPLAYLVHGAGDPVLLMHGFPLSGAMWEPVAERLRDRFRLIIPDLRGHGGSGASEDAGMEQYAADLTGLLDEIGEGRPVVLVGHSMGGYIGFEVFRRIPEKVRALVLVNTRASADSEEAVRGRHETADRVLRDGTEFLAAQMVQKLFAAEAPQELRLRWRELMAATSPLGAAAALRAMARRPDSSETLRKIDRPMLVVTGQEDTIIPVAEAQRMHQLASDSRLEIIPGAGHMVPVEKPAELADLLRRLLDEIDQ